LKHEKEIKMSKITLDLDADALREATVQAMLGVLTPEVREKVLEQAIRALMVPSSNSWEKGKSPIEVAFERAVDDLAVKEAQRLVAEDSVLAERIRALLRQTADKVLDSDPEKLASKMANAFVDSMRRD
jgi:hypothetical protein